MRISAEFEDLPGFDPEYKQWLLQNADKLVSAVRGGQSEQDAKRCIESCCPEKVKFFFFGSSVCVYNENAASTDLMPPG